MVKGNFITGHKYVRYWYVHCRPLKLTVQVFSNVLLVLSFLDTSFQFLKTDQVPGAVKKLHPIFRRSLVPGFVLAVSCGNFVEFGPCLQFFHGFENLGLFLA
jgi:hypothetical protein